MQPVGGGGVALAALCERLRIAIVRGFVLCKNDSLQIVIIIASTIARPTCSFSPGCKLHNHHQIAFSLSWHLHRQMFQPAQFPIAHQVMTVIIVLFASDSSQKRNSYERLVADLIFITRCYTSLFRTSRHIHNAYLLAGPTGARRVHIFQRRRKPRHVNASREEIGRDVRQAFHSYKLRTRSHVARFSQVRAHLHVSYYLGFLNCNRLTRSFIILC